ncbi:hypothetical protein MJO28_004664 [Puccinia striiformis f. sp. tritici]|uniref:Uncharacterized protein n=1 Tax=Puccinia striiformis f. sp. tritici TaxID=168172 RepID=A0ACC0ERW3_9BASI|nr:hypothetical protein MJO28_004664 [Puccinia striiformis f. sp. tritici]KAI7963211.1 hypothetical protein MJO29_003638 [Puccinia striiformis f. sp. tritici]
MNPRVARDIQTKIQEIQTSSTNACDWLCNTGQGLLAEDIANGTENIRAGVLKKCKYYDDLKEVMAVQANAYPRDMVDSRSDLVPHLLGEDEPDPNEEDRPNPQLASLTGHNANFDESDSDNPREPSTVWNEK